MASEVVESTPSAMDTEATVILAVDVDGRINWIAGDVDALLGWSVEELTGAPLLTLIPKRFHAPHAEAFERFFATGQLRMGGRPLTLPARRGDGGEMDVVLQLTETEAGGRRIVVGVLRATSDHDDEATAGSLPREIRFRLQNLIASDRPVGTIVGAALQPVCAALGWAIGVVWAVDPWTERLHPLHVWERDPGRHAPFVEATRRARFAVGEGFAGTVWRTGRPWWSDDVSSEPDFRRAEIAGQCGLHSALFFPIFDGTGVIGMVEMLDDRRRGVDAETHHAAWALASEFGRHLGERLRRETERMHRQRLELAMTAAKAGMWTFHIPTGQVTWDALLEEAHGVAAGSFAGSFEAFVERIHPDDRESTLATIDAAVRERSRFEVSYRTIGDDGSNHWIEGAGMPFLDESGELYVMAGVGRNVSARVQDRELLERRATNAALGADIGRALVAVGAIEERLQRTVEAIVEHLDVAFARIWTLHDGDDTLVLRASSGMYTHLDGEHARIAVGTFKIGRIAARRRSHVNNDVVNDSEISDPDWARRTGMQAFAGFPLLLGDRCVGVIGVFSRSVFADDVVETLAAVTDSIAVAIAQDEQSKRALELLEETRRQREYAERLLADRQRVASVLQASLLPPELPEVDGLEIAAVYRSGVEDVGGDFYDLLPLGGGRWAFMMGDVCGRGPEAARLTALSRHTLRTAFLLGRGPAGALAALDRALHTADNDGRFCTVACGVLTFDDGALEVRVGVGGHPPPFTLRADGSIERVRRTGPLLGVVLGAQYAEHRLSLTAGDSLILYTDGVIEARGDGGLYGLDRLENEIGSHVGAPASDLVANLLGSVSSYDNGLVRDDLAILALRRV